jgi:hypothetical protein
MLRSFDNVSYRIRSVRIMIRLWDGQARNRGSIPDSRNSHFSTQCLYTRSGAYPASYTKGTRDFFPGTNGLRPWRCPLIFVQCRGLIFVEISLHSPYSPLGSLLYSVGVDPTENTVSIVITQQYLDCCLRIRYRGNIFTESLPSDERKLWLHYSGFQASCHNSQRISLTLLWCSDNFVWICRS